MINFPPQMWGTVYSSAPVGSIISYSSNNDIPEGYLICNGAEVAVQEYPELYTKIGNTFGIASDEYHFVLPDLRDKFIEGNVVAGTEIEAKLPNIKGFFGRPYTHSSSNSIHTKGTGAFDVDSIASSGAGLSGSGSNFQWTNYNFDASRSSSVYSDNIDTVQPPAVTMIYLIKAYEVTEEFIQEELNQDNFTIIYPNGGTEESPAYIQSNGCYIEQNPFPGYAVQCQVEVNINGIWGVITTGQTYNNNGYYGSGAVCLQHNDGDLYLITGSSHLMNGGTAESQYYNIFFYTFITNQTYPSGSSYDSLPCRIKVWKINSIDKTPTIRTQNVVNIGHNYDEGEAWCYVYPNNGTDESPANISNNSRYILENPFPGYIVSIQAEIFISNQWGCAPYMAFREPNGEYVGSGMYCFHHDDDKIVLTTGKNTLCYSTDQNDVFPSTFTSPTGSTSAPCRLKVFKMGKL